MMSKIHDSMQTSTTLSSRRITRSHTLRQRVEEWFGINDAVLKELEIEEKLIQMQNAEHEHREPFRTLLRYDLSELERLLASDPSLIKVRDCVGANVIHIAYLVGNYATGRRLVQLYPKDALNRYSETANDQILLHGGQLEEDLPYLGENILHITIIRRNVEETRWLLDFYRERHHSIPLGLFKLLTANARGKFFCGQFYFGGYPLQFAVCSNDTDIFNIVLTYCQGLQLDSQSIKAIEESKKPGLLTIFQQDDLGNNALHLCVLRNLQTMYTHVLQCAKGVIRHELRVAYEDKRREIGDVEPAQPMWLNLNKLFTAKGTTDDYVHPGLIPLESDVPFPSQANFQSWLSTETQKKVNERMLRVLNSDYHTPLTLAAASLVPSPSNPMSNDELLQRVQTLQFLIDEHKEIRWKFGPITCSLITLEGIEVPYDARCYDQIALDKSKWARMRGVLEWLCIADCEEGVSLPFIKEIIETKWDRVGKSVFMINSLLHLFVSISLTVVSLYPYASPSSIGQDYGTRVITVAYVLTALMFVCKILFDFVRSILDGFSGMFQSRYRGAALFEIRMRTIYTVAFITLFILKVIEASADSTNNSLESKSIFIQNERIGTTLCLCIAVTTSWLYTFYFFMGFPATAPFLITLYRIASRDIPYFLRFYVVLVISFGCPLAVLTSSGYSGEFYAIKHLLYVIWQLIHETVQYPDNEFRGLSSNEVADNVLWLYDIVHTGFYFCITITMLNLLIGMITNTYSQYSSNREGLVLLERYNIMSGILFRNIERKEAIQQLQTYAINDNGMYKFQIQENDVHWVNNLRREGDTSSLAKKICLFLLDPQNDFHDMTEIAGVGTVGGRKGSLAVPGACADSYRIADMIIDNCKWIDEIIVTLDSHHPGHISHAAYWRNAQGAHPEPFTTEIRLQDLLDHTWIPVDSANKEWARHYLESLERAKRFTHRIWPPHCLIGSRGCAIVEPISAALRYWEARTGRTVKYVTKGYNTKVEFYSAFQAEVTDPDDPKTHFNYELLNRLKMNDRVIICGEALSHTVNFTMRDLLVHWPEEKSRLILLTDGSSVVPGEENEAVADKFLSHLISEGVHLTTCADVFTDIEGVHNGLYRARQDKKRKNMSVAAHIASSNMLNEVDYANDFQHTISPNLQGTWRGLTSNNFSATDASGAAFPALYATVGRGDVSSSLSSSQRLLQLNAAGYHSATTPSLHVSSTKPPLAVTVPDLGSTLPPVLSPGKRKLIKKAPK